MTTYITAYVVAACVQNLLGHELAQREVAFAPTAHPGPFFHRHRFPLEKIRKLQECPFAIYLRTGCRKVPEQQTKNRKLTLI